MIFHVYHVSSDFFTFWYYTPDIFFSSMSIILSLPSPITSFSSALVFIICNTTITVADCFVLLHDRRFHHCLHLYSLYLFSTFLFLFHLMQQFLFLINFGNSTSTLIIIYLFCLAILICLKCKICLVLFYLLNIKQRCGFTVKDICYILLLYHFYESNSLYLLIKTSYYKQQHTILYY